MKIKLIFSWYRFWIGFSYDREERALYFFPLPTLGVAFDFKPRLQENPCHNGEPHDWYVAGWPNKKGDKNILYECYGCGQQKIDV